MFGIVIFIVCLLISIPLTWVIGRTPGHLARQRNHSKAEAIALCGWLSLGFWPLWFAAIIWAYTEDNRKPKYVSRPYKLSKAEEENRIDELDEEVSKSLKRFTQ